MGMFARLSAGFLTWLIVLTIVKNGLFSEGSIPIWLYVLLTFAAIEAWSPFKDV